MNDPALGGQQSAFKNKWDSSSKHETENASNTVAGLQASHDILQTLKAKRKSETAQWLSGLEKEIAVASKPGPNNSINNLSAILAGQTAAEAPPLADNTMIGQAIRWLDRMFVEFELYAAQFNLTARGTNLVVSCTRPIKRTDNSNTSSTGTNDDCLSYAGHIATQLWSLVVRGCPTKVEVFIIPAELLIAFSLSSTDESGYEPLLVIEPAWQGNEIIWHMQGHVISSDQIPALAKELFGDLIKVASGQMSEAEVLANPIQTISANENPVTPPAQISPPPKTTSAPLIEDIVNNTSQAGSNPTVAFSSPAPAPSFAAQTAAPPRLVLESLKAADQLLQIIDRDINQLMDSGKQALESDDTVTFERVKDLTAKLDVLRKGISNILTSIHQPNSQ